ncbi:MAG: OmpA family protein [Campylobacteraceae bacterium]|nr:OmpA family protein [Campylobacteraceae bacterium]
MKKFLAYSFLASMLLFTGCADKEVNMNDNVSVNNAVQDEKMAMEDKSESTLNAMESDASESMSDAQSAADALANKISNTLLDTVYFAFDKYNLKGSDREAAKMNADKITLFNGQAKVKLEGNSDEWGTDEYNYALGLKRAKATKDALVADGVDADTISLVSFGESNPVCTAKNSACWKQNRRVEYKLLP